MLRVHFHLEPIRALGFPRSDFLTALSSAVGVVDFAIQRNFDEEGGVYEWPKLYYVYWLHKQTVCPGRKILECTGALRRSINVRFEPGPLLGAGDIVAFTDVPYAAAHQFGVPEQNLPARPFLFLTEEDRDEVARAVAKGLTEFWP